MVKKYPIPSFYILAFLISWLGWAPHVAASHGVALFQHPAFQISLLLAGGGPAIAAAIVASATGGKEGLKALFRPLLRWRVHLVWYGVALLGPVVLFGGAALVESLWAGKVAGLKAIEPWFAIFPAFVGNLLINTWEEVGWRGFALPRLQARYNAVLAASTVGLLWGLWHLPLFWTQGHPFYAEPFALIGIMVQSVLYAWLYNRAKGSLLLVSLFHAAINTVGGVAYGGSYLAVTISSFLAAVVLLALSMRDWLSPWATGTDGKTSRLHQGGSEP